MVGFEDQSGFVQRAIADRGEVAEIGVEPRNGPQRGLRFAQFVAAYRLLGVVLVKAVRCWAGRIGSLGSPVVGRVAGMQLRFGVVLVVFMHALCNPDYGSDKSRSWYQIEVRCQKTACSSISATCVRWLTGCALRCETPA